MKEKVQNREDDMEKRKKKNGGVGNDWETRVRVYKADRSQEGKEKEVRE